MLHLTATNCPFPNYHPFARLLSLSASQSETLLRKYLHVKNRIDKKIEGIFRFLKKRLEKFVIIRLMIIIKIFSP